MTRRVSRRRALHVLAFSGAGAWLAFGRRPSPATVRIARPLMGTTLHLTVAGGDRDAAAAGEVVAVERGARRRLLSVVVRLEGDGQEEFEPVERIATLDREAVRDRLVASGLWTALRARPFGLIPDPGTAPRSLFVTAIDTRPLAPDPQVVLEGRDHDFVAGVQALGKLSDGPVRLCTRPGASIPGDGIEGVERHEFSGPHPAGLPGTHIHFLDPVGERKTVWHVGYQDVAAAGALFGTGRLPLESASETCGGGGPVSRRESTARNFAVAAAVAVVCSFGVSVTAVGLRGMRESAQDAGRMRNILEVAGLHDPNVSVARGFERVQTRVVDLETGEYVGEEAFDPTAVTPIPPAADVAGLESAATVSARDSPASSGARGTCASTSCGSRSRTASSRSCCRCAARAGPRSTRSSRSTAISRRSGASRCTSTARRPGSARRSTTRSGSRSGRASASTTRRARCACAS